ncbi:MAG: hypothetical protein ACT4P7_07745 [Gemmatimonadaceae bacterium]
MNRLLSRVPILLVAGSAGVVHAQGVRVMDRGSFTITVGGQRAGREDFTVSGTPGASGMEYLSKATVVFGDKRLNPSLWTDSSGAPSRYTIEVKGTSGATERWMGGITRGRVRASISSERGPSEREYVVADGAVILDDDVFHQYFFVVLRADKPAIPIVIPRRNAQIVLKASLTGSERLTIGTAVVEARHFVFTEPSGDVREVWVDSGNRVLRVSIPSRKLVATRDDPPSA